MAKKRYESSVRGKPRGKRGGRTVKEEIDFTDIPELTTEELRRAKRVGRPPTGKAKRLIALRIAPDLLLAIRKLADEDGTPYQTWMHQTLEKAVKRRAA